MFSMQKTEHVDLFVAFRYADNTGLSSHPPIACLLEAQAIRNGIVNGESSFESLLRYVTLLEDLIDHADAQKVAWFSPFSSKPEGTEHLGIEGLRVEQANVLYNSILAAFKTADSDYKVPCYFVAAEVARLLRLFIQDRCPKSKLGFSMDELLLLEYLAMSLGSTSLASVHKESSLERLVYLFSVAQAAVCAMMKLLPEGFKKEPVRVYPVRSAIHNVILGCLSAAEVALERKHPAISMFLGIATTVKTCIEGLYPGRTACWIDEHLQHRLFLAQNYAGPRGRTSGRLGTEYLAAGSQYIKTLLRTSAEYSIVLQLREKLFTIRPTTLEIKPLKDHLQQVTPHDAEALLRQLNEDVHG
ncbi:hypothetical protein BJ508DRAFT_107631 [Ascobolus immersus RN42]|uniref:Uncharacterized protein n=1 Tax=Ascobolus immersus RN42 TaxID=1160509 RepID=A0A3N4I6Y7_ASCIM|nr:hypothetical protein BJ508DRAFT_107631 [Ascobolus immersus RN42]